MVWNNVYATNRILMLYADVNLILTYKATFFELVNRILYTCQDA